MKRKTFIKGLIGAALVLTPIAAMTQSLISPTANTKGIRYEMNETNDCSVLAIMTAFDAEYYDVHRTLNSMGLRKNGEGVQLQQLSVKMHSISQKLNGHSIPMFGYDEGITLSEFAETYKEGRYLVVVDGHIVTVKDGNVYDSSRRYYNKEVKGVWIAVVKAKPLNSYTY